MTKHESANTFSDEIGFDDTSVSTNQFEKYKGTKGTTDRIAVVYAKVRRAKVNYIEGVGYVVANDFTIAKYGQPNQRFATIVAQYRTDKFGKLQQPFNESSISLKYWVFGPKKYEDLRTLNNEFPLDKHDLSVQCVEEKFQQLTLNPCKEAAWKVKPDVQKIIEAQVAAMVPALEGQLGQTLTEAQIKEKLGEVSADVGGSSAPVADANLNADDVLSSL